MISKSKRYLHSNIFIHYLPPVPCYKFKCWALFFIFKACLCQLLYSHSYCFVNSGFVFSCPPPSPAPGNGGTDSLLWWPMWPLNSRTIYYQNVSLSHCLFQLQLSQIDMNSSGWERTSNDFEVVNRPVVSADQLAKSHSHMNRARMNVICEIIKAETDYVKHLRDVVEVILHDFIYLRYYRDFLMLRWIQTWSSRNVWLYCLNMFITFKNLFVFLMNK